MKTTASGEAGMCGCYEGLLSAHPCHSACAATVTCLGRAALEPLAICRRELWGSSAR
jgi:hypothetical protein